MYCTARYFHMKHMNHRFYRTIYRTVSRQMYTAQSVNWNSLRDVYTIATDALSQNTIPAPASLLSW